MPSSALSLGVALTLRPISALTLRLTLHTSFCYVPARNSATAHTGSHLLHQPGNFC